MHESDNKSRSNNLQRNKRLELSDYFNSKKTYARYSVEIAKRLESINASVLLSELIDQYFIAKKEDRLNPDLDDGVHWCVLDNSVIEKNTALTAKQLDESLHLLTVKGFIQFSRQGRDNTLHFRISPPLIHGSKDLL